jgi:hypothetical protein
MPSYFPSRYQKWHARPLFEIKSVVDLPAQPQGQINLAITHCSRAYGRIAFYFPPMIIASMFGGHFVHVPRNQNPTIFCCVSKRLALPEHR